ncbi:hypothetical protein F5146DRAFT_724747 [Armillaria mellea]|nr:hypothetical protein F5146DRAFT_724747 [Armillaria mellea]
MIPALIPCVLSVLPLPTGRNRSRCVQVARTISTVRRECQKVMWPSHKPLCKIIQERTKKGFLLHVTERDMHFIGEMSSHDIHNKTTQLREDKKRFLRAHPEAAAYPLVLAVDYSSAPMTITIRSSLDFKDHPKHGKSWSGLVRQVKEDPRHEMVYVETTISS